MVNIDYKRNCVSQIAYHVAWCTKYRKYILVDEVAKRIGQLIDMICEENKWVILSREIQPDHIHLFVSIKPAVSVATAIKKLKGITARKLFMEFPDIKKKLWNGSLQAKPVWSPSYYVGTAGNVSAEIIKKYIERTEHMRGRR